MPKTKIAQAVGINRLSVAKHLKSDDMRLSEFIATAQTVGADPVKILDDAIKAEKQKTSAVTEAA
ncbi:hypothetical protein PT279_09170 [Bifidobacterium sp. ESL0784]|uniref:hypothetical protein n=1 Tax=Bifidobacterium sp. ESL0784 TaxID=2983231 RepID=UPI0023F809CE|nr:hypothetical protein [Bifidobacterium sp. ESL0784]MDF7641753.1 hypothetical protein [Bifidobacterium sp. ESL0784]